MGEIMNAGEFADRLGLTLQGLWDRNRRVGNYQGNEAIENYVSEFLECSTKEAALMAAQGMDGKIGSEA